MWDSCESGCWYQSRSVGQVRVTEPVSSTHTIPTNRWAVFSFNIYFGQSKGIFKTTLQKFPWQETSDHKQLFLLGHMKKTFWCLWPWGSPPFESVWWDSLKPVTSLSPSSARGSSPAWQGLCLTAVPTVLPRPALPLPPVTWSSRQRWSRRVSPAR